MASELTSDTKAKVQKVVINDNIIDLVSGFGRYQLVQCLLIFIPVVFTSMSNTNFVFAAAATKYRCKVPQCEIANATADTPAWWPPELPDYRCIKPVFKDSSCKPDEVIASEECRDWVYEDHNSVVFDFKLPCREFKRTMISSIHNLGVLVGMPIIGIVSDRWGRKTGVILNSVCICIGALKALTSSGDSGYIQYVIIEFLEAALVTGAYTSCYILLVELIGKDKRIIGSALLGVSICLGDIVLAFFAWKVPYWRHFVLVVGCPGAIFVSYIFFLEESTRWLLTNGKTERAIKLLEKIGRWNKFTVPEKLKDANIIGSGNVEIESPKEAFHVKLLFQHPAILLRLLVCSWWWFSIALVYYGLVFSAVSLPGNKYTNYTLSGVTSLTGELVPLLFLNRIGRKKFFIGCCVISGLSNIALAYTPADYSTVKVVVFLVGKMFMTCSFNTLYVYTSELMPTSARGFLMGTCSMVARIGSVLAPLVLLLGEQYETVPSILFGSAILVTALLAITTPETLHQELPDTVAEAMALP